MKSVFPFIGVCESATTKKLMRELDVAPVKEHASATPVNDSIGETYVRPPY